MNVGLKIKEKRATRSMTQAELSNLLGVSRQTLSKWENGKTLPDINSLLLLCNIFDSSLDELFRETSCIEKNQLHHMKKKLYTQKKINLSLCILLTSILFLFVCHSKSTSNQISILQDRIPDSNVSVSFTDVYTGKKIYEGDLYGVNDYEDFDEIQSKSMELLKKELATD